jgi:excisionase family DNA binding protein
MISSSPNNTSRLFTLKDVAERLSVSERTVRRLIDAGDLISIRVGHQRRVSEDDLALFLRRNRGR